MGTNKVKNNITGSKSVMNRLYFDRYLYLLLVPGLLAIIVFNYIPMGGLAIAFKDYDIFAGIWKSPWVGFKNFNLLFTSYDFWNVLRNTLLISIYKLVFGFPVPIVLALLLNELRNKYFKKTVQTIVYLPHFISWVVISGIMLSFFSPNTGAITEFFKLFRMEPINILAMSKIFRGVLVASDIWKEAGWNTIIYLASLSMVDVHLYEAATVDGAGKWKQVWHITLPAISGVIVLLLILSVGSLMNAGFDQIQVLQNNIVRSVSDIFDTYVYRIGLRQGEYSFTTAVGLFKSVVSLILILIADRTAKLIGEEGLL